uniref:Centrosomal protein kizuna n=1 Tax=Nothobranchius kuhntae TaxID=321403 RepID=A0A1A8JL76_NOTKU
MADPLADRYFEKIAAIQRSMNEKEKRRLELERDLFAYSRSDSRILQIKSSKLRSYLREICDREARAKTRNLELLRDVERMEISMKEYHPDLVPLHKQKADFLKRIHEFQEGNKKMEAEMVESVHERQQSHSFHSEKSFKQSSGGIFTGQQTSTGPDTEAGTTRVHSHQTLHRSPNHSVHSREHLPSGLLKNFRVVGEDASKPAHLSDDISGSNDSPDGGNLSDKHERTSGLLPSVRALTGAAGSVAFGSEDEREASPPVTLTGSERNPSPGNSNPTRAENSPAEHADSREVAQEPLIMADEERGLGHLMPETTFGKEAQETPDKCESVSDPSSDVQLSESSASDLTISRTQSELEEDLSEDVAPERNASYRESDVHRPESSLHSSASKNTFQLRSGSSAPAVTFKRLSMEGLFNLLESIEGRLHDEQTLVYGDSPADRGQVSRIIRLCDDAAGLNDEELEACGAVVLHELQRLSWSTETGCLLPQEVVRAHQSSSEPNEISSSLPPKAARLWDRWFKHALVLKERRVLSTERLVQLFTPLLLKRDAAYSQQAKVLLRTLLSRSSEECPSAEDESDLSSVRGPSSSPMADTNVKPSQSEHKQCAKELQSSEEDSQDESPVESGPIRETKAYQLLKQSAMQERLQSSEEEELSGFSGINHGHEEDLGRAKRSSHQDPYPRKENSQVFSAVPSKGFFPDSDDSDSEIEAALRPPTFDNDSFYD